MPSRFAAVALLCGLFALTDKTMAAPEAVPHLVSTSMDANDPYTADRQALLALAAEAEAALAADDVERFVALFDEDAVVTWLNAEVSRGKDAIRAYYRKMVGTSETAILNKYIMRPTVSEHARFFGADLAVAYGATADEFHPKARDVFRLDSRWTTVLVKENATWRIAALHLSTNVFTNPLTAEYEAAITRIGALAGSGGLLAGLLLGGVWRRTRRA